MEREEDLISKIKLLQTDLAEIKIGAQNNDSKFETAGMLSNDNNPDTIQPIISFLRELDLLLKDFDKVGETSLSRFPFLEKARERMINFANSKETIIQLEQKLFHTLRFLPQEVYGEMGRVTFNQRKLIVFLSYGLTPKAICIILDISQEMYDSRKSRLKAKINSLPSTYKESLFEIIFKKHL